jgi:hypothetical protein
VVAKPLGLPEALSVAVVAVTGVAASVATVGGAGVAKLRTTPKPSPTVLLAIAQ